MPKQLIWVSHPTEAWIQAELVSSDKDSVTVKGSKGESVKLPGDLSSYDVVVPESVDTIAENLVDMEVFNEGVILHQVILLDFFIIIYFVYLISCRQSNDIYLASFTHMLGIY